MIIIFTARMGELQLRWAELHTHHTRHKDGQRVIITTVSDTHLLRSKERVPLFAAAVVQEVISNSAKSHSSVISIQCIKK